VFWTTSSVAAGKTSPRPRARANHRGRGRHRRPRATDRHDERHRSRAPSRSHPYPTQCAEEPRLAVDVLVNGTFNVLEAAARPASRKLLARLSLSSTDWPSSFRPLRPITLTTTGLSTEPRRSSTKAPLRLPRPVRLDYIALRYFNVYGDRMDVALSIMTVPVPLADASIGAWLVDAAPDEASLSSPSKGCRLLCPIGPG
jgi:hypothetical protein